MPATMSSFNLFTKLPSELRKQIWRESLPTISTSAFFPYRAGCWTVREDSKEKFGIDQSEGVNYLEVCFQHHLLDKRRLQIPILSISSEACDIATTWLCKQGFVSEESSGPIRGDQRITPTFTRNFDPNQDILFVPGREMVGFRREAYDCIFQSKHYEQRSYFFHCEIRRLAISETLITAGSFEEFWQLDNYVINELLIIFGAKPNEAWASGEGAIPAQWEPDYRSFGSSYRWSRDAWEIDPGTCETEETISLQRFMDNYIKDLAKLDRFRRDFKQFTIRLVQAVKRQ